MSTLVSTDGTVHPMKRHVYPENQDTHDKLNQIHCLQNGIKNPIVKGDSHCLTFRKSDHISTT